MQKRWKNARLLAAVSAASVGLVAPLTTRAATVTWTGAGGDDNWGTAANFGGTLPWGNDVIFADADAQGTQGVINSIVNVSSNIATLRFSNTTTVGFHTVQIPTGVTLTING